METKEPLVSVCCITYNHVPFIRKAIEGFLMQKTDFPIEILIHDDASTDGTTEIIREYETKYPDLIFPIYEEVNQYQNGHAGDIDFFNYKRARGKYIAYCEGDDYWTDPLKLQKQVDFMEANPEYSVCFHTFRNHFVNTDEYVEARSTKFLMERNAIDGMDIDVETYFKKWYTQPMTMLFRMSSFSFEWQKRYKYYRDMHEIYHLIKNGKCRLMNFDGGVRNVHEGGISSMISEVDYCNQSLPIIAEFFQNNKKDNNIRKYYSDALQHCVRVFSRIDKAKAVRCCFTLFGINHSIKHLIKDLVSVFNANK